jgi:hypothetical protein
MTFARVRCIVRTEAKTKKADPEPDKKEIDVRKVSQNNGAPAKPCQ